MELKRLYRRFLGKDLHTSCKEQKERSYRDEHTKYEIKNEDGRLYVDSLVPRPFDDNVSFHIVLVHDCGISGARKERSESPPFNLNFWTQTTLPEEGFNKLRENESARYRLRPKSSRNRSKCSYTQTLNIDR